MTNQIEPILDDRTIDAYSESAGNDSGESLLRTIWRHKLLVGLCVIASSAIGFWLHRQKPTTFAASTNLMIRSDNPLVLDADTGNVSGGVPDFQVLSSLVRSDKIVQVAAADPEIAAVSSANAASIAGKLRGGLKFTAKKSTARDRAIASLSFDGSDPDFCVAAVNAAARAIEAYFEQERASSVNSFSALISRAEGKLLPQLNELEDKYREFRKSAPLDWSAGGEAVNPHRERQQLLRTQLLELENQRRTLMSDYKLIRSIWEKEKDLTLVTQVIQQMGVRYSPLVEAPEEELLEASTEAPKPTLQNELTEGMVTDLQIQDLELEALQVEQTLVPLEVELAESISTYGTNHPSVKSLNSQVLTTRKKLKEITKKRQDRVAELRKKNKEEFDRRLAEQMAAIEGPDSKLQEMMNAKKAAAQFKFISGYSNAIKQRIDLIDEQFIELQDGIIREKRAADALVQAETDDAAYRRQIDSVRSMLIQLEDQMAGLNISEVNNGVLVEPLMSSVTPYITGPNFNQDMLLSTLIGLGLGGLLSLMIESNARTFRNSEQISTQLSVPVIAHIPLDDGSSSRRRSQATGELAKMHPNLSVVHRPECSASEAFRCARTNILFDSANENHKVYQVTSPLPGDGKSTIASNLACTLAQSGKRTLLIDLDLRSPRLTARFELAGEPGMTNLLNGEVDPQTAIRSTAIPSLDVLPSGSIPSNPAEALLLPEMEDCFAWFRDQYDFVIVDCPPLLLVTDPAITTQYVDATILALRIVRKSKPNAKEAVSILRNAGAEIAGVVINKIDEVNVGSYYQIGGDGSYRSVGYGYGKKYRQQRAKTGETEYRVLGKSQGFQRPESAPQELEVQSVATIDALDDDIEIDFDSGDIDNR
jgi:capsular exopolysaccharide synthesis family protein